MSTRLNMYVVSRAGREVGRYRTLHDAQKRVRRAWCQRAEIVREYRILSDKPGDRRCWGMDEDGVCWGT